MHAVLQAHRTIYTTQIVNRLQEKGVVMAVEHWEQENALPLPAQFLQHSGRLVAESGQGIRYRLIGLSPIYQRNAPATDFERKALESLNRAPDAPITGIVTSGRKQYFQAIYPDRAVSAACIGCHNSSPAQPETGLQIERCDGRDRDYDPAGVMDRGHRRRSSNGRGRTAASGQRCRYAALSGAVLADVFSCS